MTKVAIIGSAGVPACYGGFETLAENLVKQLNEDYDLSVYCSTKYYDKNNRPKIWNNARIFYLPLNANGWQSIFYDMFSILHAIFYAQTLLILGVPGAFMLPFVKLVSSCKVVVNIDGLEWKRDKWNKYAKWFLKWSEKVAVKFADEVVADNAAIQTHVKESYNKNSNLIAYGANHTQKITCSESLVEKYPFLQEKYAVKVCRVEPENNVHIVLEAFAELPKNKLVMVGNWQYSEYGVELFDKYNNYPNIHLLNPIYEPTIINAIRGNANLYVHGHSAGGTNPSLVEAMYLGLPVLAFDINYNRATTHNQAIFFKKKEDLKNQIEQLSSQKLITNAQTMKNIADEHYTWENIAKLYSDLLPQGVGVPVLN